jgi:hypothetical protein
MAEMNEGPPRHGRPLGVSQLVGCERQDKPALLGRQGRRRIQGRLSLPKGRVDTALAKLLADTPEEDWPSVTARLLSRGLLVSRGGRAA